MTERRLLSIAYDMGRAHGEADAADPETLAAYLAGELHGPLSGTWADGPFVPDILDTVERAAYVTLEDDEMTYDILEAYETGYDDAMIANQKEETS